MPTYNPELLDDNFVPVSKGVDSTDPTIPLPILIDPASGALLCEV